MNYSETVSADRRLLILQVLRSAYAYTAPLVLMRKFMSSAARPVSADLLATDLAWLGEQGLIDCKTTEGELIATLTTRGSDVASGLAIIPGVRRPEPGE